MNRHLFYAEMHSDVKDQVFQFLRVFYSLYNGLYDSLNLFSVKNVILA